MTKPLEVVILGGGTAGWTTAAVLASFLPRERASIRLIESEEIGIVGVGEATLPHIRTLNTAIGVDEAELMRATQATFKLGIQFVDWGFAGSHYDHPFGVHGGPGAGQSFHHQWLRASANGLAASVEEFSYAIMAAEQNRFDFPDARKANLKSTYDYAYHFDASLYAAFLRRMAEQRGAVRVEGKVEGVEQDPETGDVSALVMQSGETIRGDFFIDCSGFRSLLLGDTLGVEWEDWSKWLPCDRALPLPTERIGDLTPYTRVTAMQAGWRWRIPLQHRTGNGYVFSSAFIDEDKATEELLGAIDEPKLAEPRLLKFQAGRRVKSWARNCVAIGLSSGFLEPLESTSIYLIQVAAMNLLPLFPDARNDRRLAAEFNRRMDVEYERIRDFLILHYHLNSRDDSELWRYCRAMEVPDSLERKIALFRHCGLIEQYKDGLFSPASWLSVFIGQGLKPRHYSPLADTVPLDRMLANLEDLRTEIRDQVEEMPKHATVIARYADAAGASSAALHQTEARL
ncbi:MAG: tryptophan halogenase family protein [Sphingomicrobium sp.]